MEVTSLSVKGQVVIPKALREALGLRPGDKFVVTSEGDAVVLRPVRENLIDRLFGKYADLDLDLWGDLRESRRREREKDLGRGV
ncbi:MAG: AbrB/MazE/SpoVT family DNA-binding domain-containing protein [Clostridia bacterium]|nr:AbrB/MazE/SpoVT family DNA-binding domain-containing protein [Clostridia bacterium]MDH7573183.1 AbrB/MazE/SpoVT family DNA-binding domain-containing protein [Clostridia bacterium]